MNILVKSLRTVAEGIDFYTKCSGPVIDLYNEINGGLSAPTYAGSSNIQEFQRSAEFIEVTSNYISESKPRKTINYYFSIYFNTCNNIFS